jgi:sugar lactone lactonase YvrE
MQLGRTIRRISELGLALGIVAVMAFAGCGGGKPLSALHAQMGGAKQGTVPSLTMAVSTFAGSGAVNASAVAGADDNASGLLATFNAPDGITTDGTNLYVADTNNHKIRKIVIATGAVTTLAGSGIASAVDDVGTLASFNYPRGITTDGTNLYVADNGNNRIRRIVIATKEVTTLAGSGMSGSTDNAIGTSATFRSPYGITTDGTNLYVADYLNNKIRMVVIASGAVSTFAGTGVAGSTDNTIGTSATFSAPYGITTDGTNLYVAEHGGNRIRQIVISSRAVTTLAGSGAPGADDNVVGTSATFITPDGITSDGTNLYVTDTGNNIIRRIVIHSGAVTTLAGSAVLPGGAVDNASGLLATFNGPSGITTDGKSLYVTDMNNNKIRKIQ